MSWFKLADAESTKQRILTQIAARVCAKSQLSPVATPMQLTISRAFKGDKHYYNTERTRSLEDSQIGLGPGIRFIRVFLNSRILICSHAVTMSSVICQLLLPVVIYEEYKEVDPLDNAEDNNVSFLNNPPLSSAPPLASVDPSAGPHPGTLRDYHPNVPVTHSGGENHLQKMDCDIQTKNNPPSFSTLKDLHTWIKGLPKVPQWYHQWIQVGSYKMKAPLMLYWRDSLEVIKHLFTNPVFAHYMDFWPYWEFEGPDNQ
ncbi:uncharacterized protein BJ212DRAFT_1301600 [Suillus subaureus]|uniref:Uncharacterized protein n=1 Tax=Suillus subaureus TaxID=48587 RepID=A0A9P7E6K5_9AGAM|nr:uncharacterized protein BJ212DRAFT_1301600 [Suillus subaureus]KAG1812058.1 hypothetical protein BJ212DRAFT_1301600 [Suillus subaureus]